ncbi:MAG: lipoate--protein ligase, partial [Fermentimonas sp.]|nr:lipoate--protein ligase [Fermentimonas sp.]
SKDPVKARKICAIGVRVSRFVTMHGLALNVNTDLSYFDYINPCGFTDRGVTSIEKEVNRKIDMNDVSERMKEAFAEVFGMTY